MPTAKRQTGKTSRFLQIWWFLHRRAQWSRPTEKLRLTDRRARPLGVPTAKRQTVQTNRFVRIWQFLHRRGDVCERRLWREERAKRSGRIKAIGERALHAMTEPLIQQWGMPHPYNRPSRLRCTRGTHPQGVRRIRKAPSSETSAQTTSACRPRSGRRYKRTDLYAVGSSCTGAPSGRALRRGCVPRFVGHDDLGVPTAKR